MLGKKKSRLNPIPSFIFSKFNSSDQCSSSSSSAKSSPWTPNYYYCHHQPRTLSFRTTTTASAAAMVQPPASPAAMVQAPASPALAAAVDDDDGKYKVADDGSDSLFVAAVDGGEDPAVESVIRGLKSSERLFFSPGETSSALLQEGKIGEDCEEEGGDLLFSIKGGGGGDGGGGAGAVAVTLDSRDPFEDFKISMAEMVEAHGLRDWESLENLLSCYLRVNGKSNHGYIVGAFVDLLVGLPFGPKTTPPPPAAETAEAVSESNCSCSHHRHQGRHNQYSPSSPLSFYTSFSSSSSSEDSSSTPCVSSSEAYREAAGDEIEVDGDEISTPCGATSFVGVPERRK
ncbi:Transcription repressor OFP13 [Linum perenne]